MTDADFKPKRRDDLRSETVKDEIVLYDPAQGQAVYLNDTAAVVWQLLDGTRSADDIVALLEAEMGNSSGRIGTDVRETISKLVTSNLVR